MCEALPPSSPVMLRQARSTRKASAHSSSPLHDQRGSRSPIHPSTCLKLKNQCLCIYCYSSLPCDDEVPCGCALCGMKCAGEFVDPVAYNSKSKGPGAQTMERNLAPVAAGAGSAV